MTLTNTEVKHIYTANGTTVDYAITFDYFSEAQVLVVSRDESVTPATETTLTEGAGNDYTLTGDDNGLPTTVSFNTAPTAGLKIIISRQSSIEQTVDYITDGSFQADDHEEAMDKIVAMVQEVDEKASRAITLQSGSASSDISLGDPVALQVLRWNATEDAIESVDVSTLVDETNSISVEMANNSGPTAITGLLFSSADAIGWSINYLIPRKTATQSAFEIGIMHVWYNTFASAWHVDTISNGDDAGITWSITGGQVYATANNMTGGSHSCPMNFKWGTPRILGEV
jgi:hypothetical protein